MKKFTAEEQKKAIEQVVQLINDYGLSITTEHQIKIIPDVQSIIGDKDD